MKCKSRFYKKNCLKMVRIDGKFLYLVKKTLKPPAEEKQNIFLVLVELLKPSVAKNKAER